MPSLTSDERRARWQRSVFAKEAAGFPVERDPRFLAWIEEWVAGDIPMQEVQQRYATLVRSRRTTIEPEKPEEAQGMQTILESIREAVPEISGLPITTAEERALRAKRSVKLCEADEI